MLGEEEGEGEGGILSFLGPQACPPPRPWNPAPRPIFSGQAAPPESRGPSWNLLPHLPLGEECLSVARRPGSGP